MIKYLFLLIPFLTFGQIDLLKYSTLYTSFSMNNSIVERSNYQAIQKGYEDITRVNPYDYDLTIGLRKVARWDYQYKVKTWYYGKEKNYSDASIIPNSFGFDYLFNYSFTRYRGDKFNNKNFWIKYVREKCATKIQYQNNQRVGLRYNSIDTRYRISKKNWDITLGAVGRRHSVYGVTPIEDFWTPGEQSFAQLANEFGYSTEYVNGDWHWFRDNELIATSNDEFYKHYFGDAVASFNERELEKLGDVNEISAVIGIAYYDYTPKMWIHVWADLMPFHYGMDTYSYQYGESALEGLDWDTGLILGVRLNKHLGIFVEGVHQRYWDIEVFECKFGFNYLTF